MAASPLHMHHGAAGAHAAKTDVAAVLSAQALAEEGNGSDAGAQRSDGWIWGTGRGGVWRVPLAKFGTGLDRGGEQLSSGVVRPSHSKEEVVTRRWEGSASKTKRAATNWRRVAGAHKVTQARQTSGANISWGRSQVTVEDDEEGRVGKVASNRWARTGVPCMQRPKDRPAGAGAARWRGLQHLG